MGFLFVLVAAGISAGMIFFFGYSLWVMIVLGLLWLATLIFAALCGHYGSGRHGNTPLIIVIAGLVIATVIIFPQYQARKPCAQAIMALTKLADAENKYFAAHKTFAPELQALDLKQNPDIYLMILKADEKSFMAAASPKECEKEKSGNPDVFTWDSAKGGLQ